MTFNYKQTFTKFILKIYDIIFLKNYIILWDNGRHHFILLYLHHDYNLNLKLI